MNAVRIAKALRALADAIEETPAEAPEPAKSETRIVVTDIDRAKARKALRRMGEKV